MKKILWSNIDINENDYKNAYLELTGKTKITNDEDFSEFINYNLTINFNLICDDLDKKLNNDIIIIASIGSWNGRRQGYKVIGDNLVNCLKGIGKFDYAEFFYDSKDFQAVKIHHDGTNRYTFRVFKNGVNQKILKEKLYNGTATRKDITRYTTGLKNKVASIYGM